MKIFLTLFLIIPFQINAEEENFPQCIASALEAQTSASYMECLNKFEINDIKECTSHIVELHGKTEEEASSGCYEILMGLDVVRYIEDRPADEFYDVFTKAKEEEMDIKSYGCSVPINKDGLEEYNALVTSYDGMPLSEGAEVTSEDWYTQKAMIHIIEDMNYAEVNFGTTIYPITDYRFFTNIYIKDGDRLVGIVDNTQETKFKGGTDRGHTGRGWVINTTENILTIFMSNVEVGFISDCKWNDIDIDELENN